MDEGVCAGQGFRRRRDGSSGDERKNESCDRRDRQKVCDLDVWGVRRSTSRYLPIRTRIGDGRKMRESETRIDGVWTTKYGAMSTEMSMERSQLETWKRT